MVVAYDDNGQPKTKNVLAKTKAECLEKLKKLQEEWAPHIRKCSPEMPFGDWMDFWYQTYCKPKLRESTQINYEERIYKHIIPELGRIPLNEDTPLTHGYVRRRMKQTLERAQCKVVRFHDLRHTFAMVALEHGMDVKTFIRQFKSGRYLQSKSVS